MSEQSFTKGLYLVATPIGNLGDISQRAVDILNHADLVACEDTRNTAKLFSLIGVSAKLTAYHEYNADTARPKLIRQLQEGKTIALVSDAGTPLVSDPGYRLVQDCLNNDIYVTAVPGPAALLCALQLSGLPSHRFMFEGFLPPKSAARQKELSLLKNVPATIIFYEAPQRLPETLTDIRIVFGNRKIAAMRELTKKFEEGIRGTIDDVIAYFNENEPRGEFVIVVAPPEEKQVDDESIKELLNEAMKKMSVKDAAAFVAEQTGEPKKRIYQTALELKK